MKKIRAIIRSARLGQLRSALREISNFPRITVFRVECVSGPASLGKRTVRDELTDFSDEVMVLPLAPEEMVGTIVEMILRECGTGQGGGGLIWVMPVESLRRIRDGSLI